MDLVGWNFFSWLWKFSFDYRVGHSMPVVDRLQEMKVPVETKSIVVLSSRDGATSITHRQLVPRNRRNIRSGSPVGCVTCNANCRERCTKAGSGSYRDCVVWQRTLVNICRVSSKRGTCNRGNSRRHGQRTFEPVRIIVYLCIWYCR